MVVDDISTGVLGAVTPSLWYFGTVSRENEELVHLFLRAFGSCYNSVTVFLSF